MTSLICVKLVGLASSYCREEEELEFSKVEGKVLCKKLELEELDNEF